MSLISDSSSICGPVVPRLSVAENEEVDFTCKMTYKWHSVGRNANAIPNINESFGWVNGSETLSSRMLENLKSTATKQTVVQNMTVSAAKKPAVPAQTCTLSFSFAPSQRLAAGITFAVNPVSYTCSTDPIPVQRKFHCG